MVGSRGLSYTRKPAHLLAATLATHARRRRHDAGGWRGAAGTLHIPAARTCPHAPHARLRTTARLPTPTSSPNGKTIIKQNMGCHRSSLAQQASGLPKSSPLATVGPLLADTCIGS